MKKIKSWFRRSLDIIAQSVEEKTILIDEASKAFIFNSDLFIDLEKHTVVAPELNQSGKEPVEESIRMSYVRVLVALLLLVVIGYWVL